MAARRAVIKVVRELGRFVARAPRVPDEVASGETEELARLRLLAALIRRMSTSDADDAIVAAVAELAAQRPPAAAAKSGAAPARRRDGTKAGRSADPAVGTVLRVKVLLLGSKPLIWRRLLVSADTPLEVLHDILQQAMGWTDSHLHCFEMPDRRFIQSDPSFDSPTGSEDERGVTIGSLLCKVGDRMTYEYDFGDGWEHGLELEAVLPADPAVRTPAVLAGARACPPEDVGGVHGYAELLKVLGNPKHPQHREMREWIGGRFDPTAFDLAAADAAVASVGAHRRRGGRRG